ncbi:MAG: peptidoglycan-binding domain-containing protein [Acidobacteriota bacterium]
MMAVRIASQLHSFLGSHPAFTVMCLLVFVSGTVLSTSQFAASAKQSKSSRQTSRKSVSSKKANSTKKGTSVSKKRTRRKRPVRTVSWRNRGQREIEASRVSEIQSALAEAGYYKGEPSGEWDATTSSAMKEYQGANGFKVTGKPDALSLKKLGLTQSSSVSSQSESAEPTTTGANLSPPAQTALPRELD